jgi:hypothetical protein
MMARLLSFDLIIINNRYQLIFYLKKFGQIEISLYWNFKFLITYVDDPIIIPSKLSIFKH